MKKVSVLLRILCGIVDTIIIMIPVQFIMMGIFRVSSGQADFLFKFLFAVYGVLLTEYMGGTVGKYLGRMCCMDADGGKSPVLYMGLRELSKSLYFIPIVGWTAAIVSIIMIVVREDGRALHDLVGRTKVIYKWQQKEEGYGEC